MIQIRVRAFHLDHMPRCEHGRVTCRACGLDPFEPSPEVTQEAIRHALNDGECADWFARAHARDLDSLPHTRALADGDRAQDAVRGGFIPFHDEVRN